jgi:hypothetical protein
MRETGKANRSWSHKPSVGTIADTAETSLCATCVLAHCLDPQVAQALSLNVT